MLKFNSNRTSKVYIYFILIKMTLIALCYYGLLSVNYTMTGIVLSTLVLVLVYSMKVADQWEKAVVLRFGKFVGLRGPGLFFIIPVVDRIDKYIDQRVKATDISAERALTKDTVPVNVDAVLYWLVWDAEKAALEVEKYDYAVNLVAQTALRDIIGRYELAEILSRRKDIGNELQKFLDEQTNPWGITCQSVGIKEIVIPAGLSDAMSKQAQAERERQARIILGTAETEIADKFRKASEAYAANPIALQLRGMNMLYEGLKEKGSLVIVPCSGLESMNLGAVGGVAGLSQHVSQQAEEATTTASSKK